MTEAERLEMVGIRLPASLTEELDAKAKEMDCSRSVLIRSILREFLDDARIVRLDDYLAEAAEAQFRISVLHGTPRESDTSVVVESDDPEFLSWMCACEYFMSMTAEKSGLPFDEALCKLCEGAHEYENKILRLRGARGPAGIGVLTPV